MKYFIESNDELFANQISIFASELPNYAALLGFTAAEVKEAADDAAYMQWVVKMVKEIEHYDAEAGKFKDIARHGAANAAAPFADN